MIKTIITAALFGLSLNAVAAVSDLSNVTHGSQAGQELKVGQISEPRFSDRNAGGPQTEVKPFAEAAGNYSFGDLSSVTHN
ncbi:MAG: hypothetical protein JSU95_06180 [Betaproteobacteria bacterium]|nr:MAG: hypothetical protein JSU95_06180 [Betaproteobacteria bacterium]